MTAWFLASRGPLSPLAQLSQHRQLVAVLLQLLGSPHQPPRLARVDGRVQLLVGNRRHLVRRPLPPALLPQLPAQIVVHRVQVAHVVDRVLQLLGSERPLAPVGHLVALADVHAVQLGQQLAVADHVPVAAVGSSHLRVEHADAAQLIQHAVPGAQVIQYHHVALGAVQHHLLAAQQQLAGRAGTRRARTAAGSR